MGWRKGRTCDHIHIIARSLPGLIMYLFHDIYKCTSYYCVYVRIYVCTCACVYVYVYIYIYVHMYIYMHTLDLYNDFRKAEVAACFVAAALTTSSVNKLQYMCVCVSVNVTCMHEILGDHNNIYNKGSFLQMNIQGTN